MTARCQNLNALSDVCDVASCISKVVGLASGSASPSDTWLLTLKPGANYDGFPLTRAFLKFHINYRSLEALPDVDLDRDLLTLYGLEYEIKIYRDIIKPMIDRGICPNFLLFLGAGQNCALGDLMDMLMANIPPRATAAQRDQQLKKYEDRFERNITYMANQLEKRPSITTDEKLNLTKQRISPSLDWRFNLLLTHQIKAEELFDFFDTHKENSAELWIVLFQVAAACYAMSLAHLTHNDLHIGNIWVKKLSAERNLLYVYGGVYYQLQNVRHKSIVFDFDRSHSDLLGRNELIVGNTCHNYAQCNEFIPNKDVIKMFYYLYDEGSAGFQAEILDILCPTASDKEFLKGVFAMDSFLQVPRRTTRNKSVTAQEFATKFFPMKRILNNVFRAGANKFPARMTIIDPPIRNVPSFNDLETLGFTNNSVFVCDENQFQANGNIKPINQSRILMNTILAQSNSLNLVHCDHQKSQCEARLRGEVVAEESESDSDWE